MKVRIYVDTSVVGGGEEGAWRGESRRLRECFIRGEYIVVLSDLTIQELAAAAEHVRRRVAEVPEEYVEALQLTAETRELAEAYIAEGVISSNMRADAQHIAMATLTRVDVLVSWNFKHIVNLHRLHGYNAVNLRRDYPPIEIPSPRAVLRDE